MFINNKYYKLYYSIIDRARSRKLNEYFEKHHIIPKSLGGSNSSDNLVSLTAREHFICHRLLVKITAGNNKRKMAYAVRRMLSGISKHHQRNYITSSKIYEIIRKENNKHIKGYQHSNDVKKKMSDKMKGRKFSPETLLKMSSSKKGKPQPDHVAQRLRTARLGATTSDEVKEKISKALTGRKISQQHKDNMSKNHANVSGINNPRAKIWEITDPVGNVFIVQGDMSQFCKEQGLPATTMRGLGRSGKTSTSGKCVGWKVKILNFEQA